MTANSGSSRYSYKRNRSRKITRDLVPRTVNRTMSALLTMVEDRVNHFKSCKAAGICGNTFLACRDDTVRAIKNEITNATRSISAETAGSVIRIVCEESELFGEECKCEIVDSVQRNTCSDDTTDQTADPDLADKLADDKLLPRQSMYYVENYFTPSIWEQLGAPEFNRGLFVDIMRLLSNLGMRRPREEFWDHLCGTLQWATGGKMHGPFEPDKEVLQYLLENYDFEMNWRDHTPMEYPRHPRVLQETHPHLYDRAYTVAQQPIAPPSLLDTNILAQLKCSPISSTVPPQQPPQQPWHLGWLSKPCWCSESCVTTPPS